VVLIVVAVIVLTSGGGTVSPDEFAASVCEGWRDDAEDVADLGTAIEEAFGSDPDEESMQEVGEVLRNVADAFDALADEMEGAGTPDVEDGEELVNTSVEAIRGLADDFREGADLAEETDPQDPDQLDELGSFFNELEEGEDPFTELDSVDELEQAFDDDETCQEIEELL
jgi:acyl-CoA reductase-like NAD-dependent aldehyde dehydrogenase